MENPESKILNRPTIEEKIYYFRKMKENSESGDLQSNMDELKEFANGEGDNENKEQWYYNWKQEDFKELLDKLEEEGIV